MTSRCNPNEFHYARGTERPVLRLPWQEEDPDNPGTYDDLDLSSGYTFTLTLTKGSTTETPDAVPSGGVGYVDIPWAADDLDLEPGPWTVKLTATQGGLDRRYSPNDPPIIVII